MLKKQFICFFMNPVVLQKNIINDLSNKMECIYLDIDNKDVEVNVPIYFQSLEPEVPELDWKSK